MRGAGRAPSDYRSTAEVPCAGSEIDAIEAIVRWASRAISLAAGGVPFQSHDGDRGRRGGNALAVDHGAVMRSVLNDREAKPMHIPFDPCGRWSLPLIERSAQAVARHGRPRQGGRRSVAARPLRSHDVPARTRRRHGSDPLRQRAAAATRALRQAPARDRGPPVSECGARRRASWLRRSSD